ncbi:unnamed protein product [marine sediment metagenome]|uniref:Uncharacterized protein n=1 Tax=marine sediment metagenome TaxID=412755 RepID=X1BWU5_9ZZZZ
MLAAYDAGLQSTPPVDPNPKATKAVFSPDSRLYKNWQYFLIITGAFDDNGWRETHGAKNINGMSIEYDEESLFYIE